MSYEIIETIPSKTKAGEGKDKVQMVVETIDDVRRVLAAARKKRGEDHFPLDRHTGGSRFWFRGQVEPDDTRRTR